MSMMLSLRAARPTIAAFSVMGILWGSFAAILPDLKTMLGVDETRLGMLMLFTPIAGVVAMLLAPRIGTALGRVALPVATVLMALAFALPGQVQILWLFPLAMLCCGAATGLTDVLMNARTAQIEHERGLHLMGLSHAAYSFGYAGGAIATGVMRGAEWSPAMVLGTMAGVAFVVAIMTIERDGRIAGLRAPKGGGGPGLGMLPVLGGGMVLVAFLTENAAESWSALHIEQTLGGSPEQGSMGPAALALTMGFARLAGNGLAERFGPFRLLKGGAVIASIGAMLAATAVSPPMAYVGFVVMGIGASVIAPTVFSLVGRLGPDEARGRAVARATLFGYFGYFFGPPMLGVIAGTFGLRYAFVFAAVALMLILVLAPMMAAVANRQSK
ncbi:MFS transporter [Xinfangfangia sp. CPCC 101601]|uniref:MFS transporter n=1 Tax=Pseudogemmobacter lacusdianii TaxID=3069608 RepID=A0ABU0VX72_9RHOB|nr:MFS transporter [Xinfangfangia sp. CPCC 101601]MDQ2066103.1 MFS transporter [Xinfangfangia sp. CPCC 101601]